MVQSGAESGQRSYGVNRRRMITGTVRRKAENKKRKRQKRKKKK
jgi:hypothetical protein